MVIVGTNGIINFPQTDIFMSGGRGECTLVPVKRSRWYSYGMPPAAGKNLLPFATYQTAERAREVLAEIMDAYAKGCTTYNLPAE